MAILEKEVWVKLHKKNIDHYKHKGYCIPTNSNKKSGLKGKAQILVEVQDLLPNSRVEVTKVCDSCGAHIGKMQFRNIRTSLSGTHACMNCAGVKREENKRDNMSFDKTFEFFALNNSKELLLKEWCASNRLKPRQLAKASGRTIKWNCSRCNNGFTAKLNDRVSSSSGCPYCARKKTNSINNLHVTHPYEASLLKDKSLGFNLLSGSKKEVIFSCPNCNKDVRKMVQSVTKYGLKCNHCSDGFSYPMKFIVNLLSQLNIDHETEKSFSWSNNKRYDIFIPDINCIIEVHGNQHYQGAFSSVGGRTLEEEKENDLYKKESAINNGITKYIELDCSKSELYHIRNSVENSVLRSFINLKDVDWIDCHRYACNSIIKTVSDYYNLGIKDTQEIASHFGYSRRTIIEYLKKGAELGWCKYNSVDTARKNLIRNAMKNQRPVIQIGLDDTLLKNWDSAKQAGNCLQKPSCSITNTCKGRQKSAYGYKWMYKEDYEKYLEDQKQLVNE